MIKFVPKNPLFIEQEFEEYVAECQKELDTQLRARENIAYQVKLFDKMLKEHEERTTISLKKERRNKWIAFIISSSIAVAGVIIAIIALVI